MPKYTHLEGEFPAVKEYSYNDLKDDRFVRHFKPQPPQNLNYAFDNPMIKPSPSSTSPGSKKRGVMLMEKDELADYFREKEKRRLLRKQAKIQRKLERLAGSNSTMADSSMAESSTADSSMADSSMAETTMADDTAKKAVPAKKKRVYLVPMDDEYRKKMLAWIEKRQASASGDCSAEAGSSEQDSKVSTFAAGGPQGEDPADAAHSERAQFREILSSEAESEPEEAPKRPVLASKHDVALLKSTVLQQIHGSRPSELSPLLKTAYNEVHALFKQTIDSSESHTAFLMGPSGSGKSLVVDLAVEDMHRTHPRSFIVIRLGGDIHRTENVAIREFARQLDMQVKGLSSSSGAAFEQRSISDTFHNILAALNRLDNNLTGDSAGPDSIRILIIIDQIDEYTRTPRQTLLYNLLESCQASRIPICLLGVTRNIAIRENLEKRVRSRFSQRVIETKKAPTLDTFWKNARSSLTISKTDFKAYDDPKYPDAWNSHINSQFYLRTPTLAGLRRIVTETFVSTRNYKHLLNCCCLAVKSISVYEPFPQPHKFDAAYVNSFGASIDAQMDSLSEVEKLLLIAAARWVEKSELRQVNYKLAHKEYKRMVNHANLEATTLTSKTSSIDNLSLAGIKVTRSIMSYKACKDSWATLYKYGLLFDVITTNNEVNAHNNHNRNKEISLPSDKMVQVDVSLDELGKMMPESLLRYTRL